MLAHEGVSERGIHGPLARSLRTGRCRMSRLGAGCPLAHEEPDVQASGRMSGLEFPNSSALWLACSGFPGGGAGCPGLWEEPAVRGMGPDVRAVGVASRALWIGSGRISGGRAGCPGPIAASSSSFSFLRSRAHFALVLGLSLVSSGVPEYAQGPRLK